MAMCGDPQTLQTAYTGFFCPPLWGGANEILRFFCPHIWRLWGANKWCFAPHFSGPWGANKWCFAPHYGGQTSPPQAENFGISILKMIKFLMGKHVSCHRFWIWMQKISACGGLKENTLLLACRGCIHIFWTVSLSFAPHFSGPWGPIFCPPFSGTLGGKYFFAPHFSGPWGANEKSSCPPNG